MRFKISQNSLFAQLSRAPWWVGLVVAFVVWLAARMLLPETYALFSWSLALPFVVTSGIAAWRQVQQPSAARVEATVETTAAMSWREFSDVMERAFQRDGYSVKRSNGVADFVLTKDGRTTLVSCKRWKAAGHGVDPLRDLLALHEKSDAQAALYVALFDLSENARRFARDNGIAVMDRIALTKLLRMRG